MLLNRDFYRLNRALAFILLPLVCLISGFNELSAQNQSLFELSAASIKFTSDAPLELIQAETETVKGIMTADGQFAFSVEMKTFRGFNTGLQREHFNENYMETSKYPKASFEGTIIEDVDFDNLNEIRIRARGIFSVHGVQQERIIPIELSREGTEIKFSTTFQVPLAEHKIEIPQIMYQKIAETIDVSVDGVFLQ
jgi:polyisoprenoid-binding protein YceI